MTGTGPAERDHGGGLTRMMVRYPHAPRPWIDLSTGINRNPYPIDIANNISDAWTRLPDDDLIRPCIAAARRFYGAASDDQLCLGPGSQALIQALPFAVPRGRVAVLGPTYNEHGPAWRRAGHAVCVVTDPADLTAPGIDTALVVNPNNPDGRLHAPDMLMDLAQVMARRGGRLVVDEAFGETTPAASVAASAGPALIVLRSFGKFFGLAGLRLGVAIADPPVAAAMADHLGPWAVSGPALAVAAQTYGDAGWAARTRDRLAEDARRLDRLLAGAGLEAVGGTDLFRTVDAGSRARAAAILAHLAARHGILIRDWPAAVTIPEQAGWLRFGIPAHHTADAIGTGDADEWQRLAAALADVAMHTDG
ncbi:threonine-phosphate decarboxylase [Tistrella bauzanensis]|uniref:threonine-phosphate decarboxylase n=1 Tax=Tistrella bauzanensis TaxID=657419 RepID=A0ABQ1IJF3_9PROT|nr:threonine-phosphate decarboxylase CobD [Tistrella bauzanensis]GGB43535.1 threonine-phosphate decarboxylase [Tistrella bauzanensis]